MAMSYTVLLVWRKRPELSCVLTFLLLVPEHQYADIDNSGGPRTHSSARAVETARCGDSLLYPHLRRRRRRRRRRRTRRRTRRRRRHSKSVQYTT